MEGAQRTPRQTDDANRYGYNLDGQKARFPLLPLFPVSARDRQVVEEEYLRRYFRPVPTKLGASLASPPPSLALENTVFESPLPAAGLEKGRKALKGTKYGARGTLRVPLVKGFRFATSDAGTPPLTIHLSLLARRLRGWTSRSMSGKPIPAI